VNDGARAPVGFDPERKRFPDFGGQTLNRINTEHLAPRHGFEPRSSRRQFHPKRMLAPRWMVATEQGGIALRSAIYVYQLGKDGKTAKLIDQRTGFLNNVCGAATKLAGR